MRNKLTFGARVRHPADPNKWGMVLSTDSDGFGVVVQWSEGGIQWMPRDELKVQSSSPK
jgi:hypothetical protein